MECNTELMKLEMSVNILFQENYVFLAILRSVAKSNYIPMHVLLEKE